MRAKLLALGRAKFTGEVEVKDMKQLEREVQRHLMSRGWSWEFTEGDSSANIVVGGFRTVGVVELLGGCFKSVETIELIIQEKETTT